MVASHTPPTGDLAHNPDLCPDWELNQRPFGLQAGTQSTELHQQGREESFGTCLFLFIVDTITDVPHCLPSVLFPSVPALPTPRPSPHCCLCPWAMHTCIYALWLISSSSLPTLLSSDSCQSVPCIHASGFILSVYFVCWIPYE